MPIKSISDVNGGPYDSAFKQRTAKMARAGFCVSALFTGLIAASMFVIHIEGAIVSQASVVPTGHNKIVQHREGGIVKELLVSNGDSVESGQPLLVLNNTSVRAEHNVLGFRRIELGAKIARLKATASGAESFSYKLPSYAKGNAKAEYIVRSQRELFRADRETLMTGERKLSERIAALSSEIVALDTQIATTAEQVSLVENQLADITPLVQQQLVPKTREWDLKRAQVNARSQLDSLNVSKVKAQTALTESENERRQLMAIHEQDTFNALEAVEAELQATVESHISLQDQLARHVIKAPVSGKIHEINVFNQDGVIRPGETIMKIVPQGQGVELDTQIKPSDVDQIYIGQKVRLRFDAFDVNKTPEIFGHVTRISADRSADELTGQTYFSVSVSVDQGELKNLGAVDIVSGMPVTAMITTQNRTLFSYLVKPIADQSARAFR